MSAPRPVSLSIVLCTYNRATQLDRTLESLNGLTQPADVPLELVVINNNSKDATPDVCRAFETRARLPYRWVTETRQGLSHARNRGLEEATGSAVIFTDDDITVPAAWAQAYAAAFRDHDADAVFGRIVPEWGGDRPDWYDPKFSAIYGALDYGPAPFVVRTRNFEFFGANFACRKDVLQAIGGFDPRLGRTPEALYISEERKIFLDLMARGATIVYEPSLIVHHHISPEMKTKAYVTRYYRDTALSLVTITAVDPRRQFLGIPYYRLYEGARTIGLFVPRALALTFTGRWRRLFPLRLDLARTVRMLWLYVQRRGRRPGA